jgi:hypothetical protein
MKPRSLTHCWTDPEEGQRVCFPLRRLLPYAAFLAFAVPALASHVDAAEEPEPELVSLVQLIANPSDHHGKLIQAVGFCWLEFEGNGL